MVDSLRSKMNTKDGANALDATNLLPELDEVFNKDFMDGFQKAADRRVSERLSGMMPSELRDGSTYTLDGEKYYFKVGDKVYEMKTEDFEVEYEIEEVGYRGEGETVFGGVPTTSAPDAYDLLNSSKIRLVGDDEQKEIGLTEKKPSYPNILSGLLPGGAKELFIAPRRRK
jgi:hypothetical protein